MPELLQQTTSETVCSKFQIHREHRYCLAQHRSKDNFYATYPWRGLGSHRSVRTTGATRERVVVSQALILRDIHWCVMVGPGSVTSHPPSSVSRATGKPRDYDRCYLFVRKCQASCRTTGMKDEEAKVMKINNNSYQLFSLHVHSLS